MRRRWTLRLAAVAVLAVLALGPASAGGGAAVSADAPFAPGGVCLPGTTPDHLSGLFAGEPGGVIGADYQRATELDDGRVLWTFQDADVRLPDGSSRLVHNIGMVQTGACFQVLMSGSPGDPRPWLFATDTAPLFRWFWPLGAEEGTDGRLYVFAAEMHERGDSYLTRVEPTATYVAAIDTATWNVDWYGQPFNRSDQLYGWSIASDDDWTYLYAQCHRQFGYDPYIFVLAHDRSCSSDVMVGRVPNGRLLEPPRYWDGRRWQPDPARAVSVVSPVARSINPTQFTLFNNHWMAITKVDDWWGDRLVVEQSRRPEGPFDTVATLRATPKCPVECNTYFASWIPGHRSPVFGLSHNLWQHRAGSIYRPTFDAVEAPEIAPFPADRCRIGQCD